MTELPSNATKRLKTMAISAGAAVVGVADAAAFDAHAPARHRPADLLPGARTVVVVGGAQPRAGDWVATSPWLLSTMGTTERIQGVGRRLAQSIESELGYYALYVPPGTASGGRLPGRPARGRPRRPHRLRRRALQHARAHALGRRLPEGARGDPQRARPREAQDAGLRRFHDAHPVGDHVLVDEHRAVLRV